MFRRAISILSIFILAATAFSPGVFAATEQNSSSNGLEIYPVRTSLTISPGQSQTVPITVINPGHTTVKIAVIFNDFKPLGQNGSPQLILNGSSTDPHGLKQFIAPVQDFTIAPNQQSTVHINVTIPKGTPGGGYYAAVRFAPVNLSSTSNLTLAANVASLILVTVPGASLKEQVSVDSFNISRNGNSGRFFLSPKGINAVVLFKNTGNVQEAPYGKVEILSGNKVISTTAVNSSSSPGYVLPGSIRQFSVPINGLGSVGKYKISGFFGYGSGGNLLTVSKTIYVVSAWIIVLAVVILAIIVFAIIFFVWRKKKRSRIVINRGNS